MILSVSRRTDIPAFYTDWFFNRLKDGYVLVRNPMNYNQISRVSLDPKLIDCMVFWTKDPTNMIKRLDELKEYKYYFQITITPYNEEMERNIRDKDSIINSFKILSEKIGKDKVIWRYDPIVINEDINIEYHIENFNRLASKLSNYTNLCIISFMDLYRKTERNMKTIKPVNLTNEIMLEIGEQLSNIAKQYNLSISTCSEIIDLSSIGIQHAKCIDDRLISKILGQNLNINKDKNQRDICGCVSSIDIGAYNTCKHGCLYCYANYSDNAVINNLKKHDKNSPFIIGNVEEGDIITERKMVTYRQDFMQPTFFDIV